mmetsp:Transcript_12410/g.35516  ORF Transcript_12410/g.35516 Transcript_12410/m.35516 type:complete len:110 (-) Transcript_12410:606-935(-)
MGTLAYFVAASKQGAQQVIHCRDALNDDDADKEKEGIYQAKGLANSVGNEEWKPGEDTNRLTLFTNFVTQPERKIAVGGNQFNDKGRQDSGQGKGGPDHQIKETTEGLA